MSERKPKLLLEDILESAEKIISYTKGMSYPEFILDDKPLTRLPEISRSLEKLPPGYRMTLKTIKIASTGIN